jgi:hypothetical protein
MATLAGADLDEALMSSSSPTNAVTRRQYAGRRPRRRQVAAQAGPAGSAGAAGAAIAAGALGCSSVLADGLSPML